MNRSYRLTEDEIRYLLAEHRAGRLRVGKTMYDSPDEPCCVLGSLHRRAAGPKDHPDYVYRWWEGLGYRWSHLTSMFDRTYRPDMSESELRNLLESLRR